MQAAMIVLIIATTSGVAEVASSLAADERLAAELQEDTRNGTAVNAKPRGKRILGGYRISIEDAPWLAALLFRGSILRTGSLVSEKAILSAGLVGRSPYEITVRLGSSNWNSGGTVVRVKRIFTEPDCTLAVLWLAERVQQSRAIKIIPMFLESQFLAVGSKVLTMGWGRRLSEPPNYRLERFTSEIRDLARCDQWLRVNSSIYLELAQRGRICANYDDKEWHNKHICFEDYGTPLVKSGRVVGVYYTLAGRDGCGDLNVPSLLYEVAYYRKWINLRLEDIVLSRDSDAVHSRKLRLKGLTRLLSSTATTRRYCHFFIITPVFISFISTTLQL